MKLHTHLKAMILETPKKGQKGEVAKHSKFEKELFFRTPKKKAKKNATERANLRNFHVRKPKAQRANGHQKLKGAVLRSKI